MSRISWREYALEIASVAAMRSEDPYVKVGAVALREDYSIAGAGYNGAPSGIEIDWTNRDERRKKVIHAECNCLKYCRPGEVKLIASTLLPCPACLSLIASYKIPEIVFKEIYATDDSSLTLAKEFKIKLFQYRGDGTIQHFNL